LPERVELAFHAGAADYVRARQWHPSQQIVELPSGGLQMTLHVCIDRALAGWILSFGPLVRVLQPDALARDIAQQIDQARAQYN
jgi:predicted DNA-binding transcriptional regulator YafY